MCGRMTMTHPTDAMARLFDAAPSNDLPPVPRYNICPTQPVAVVTAAGGRRAMRPMRWGFLPHWYKTPTDGPLLINARAETIADKPAFRAAVRERRCLVPATGFYEWTKDAEGNRLPWYFVPADGAPLVLAGIWQDWGQGDGRAPTVAVVTTAASAWMSETHHREPVRLDPGDWATWLGETGEKAAPLMRPAPPGSYDRWRVDPRVNSNRVEGEELVRPLAS
ncbi:SOS response-associated peptidase [Roseicyclus persicicus]|uniref:Abasic site processing protein n=1 Tax=Roseicyclus persicicus TaxID=2650661 RepID=A0A7X6JXA4_9RHOB|nr:SOS response-associated peptidase [Roseibacterium persicicum]NKX44595.1 SOS response-associated peptidase [Roseibacterium persicicum]